MTAPLWERANGHWRSILPAIGIDPKFLTGKNGPCPLCGGRDRWRFDNKRGDGTWFCNHCGAGQGIKLAMMYTGIADFKTIAEKIESVIGKATPEPPRRELSEDAKRAALNELWSAGRPVTVGDPVDLWMHRRGLGAPSYPTCLHTCMQVRHSGPPVTFHPAMLAKVTDATGRPVMIHRTFLTPTGFVGVGYDHRDAAVDEIGCKRWYPIGLVLRPAIFNRHILALAIAAVLEALQERNGEVLGVVS
jgi:putative DNA primase/helicase